MGRVSRYKKVKACDPYAPGRRRGAVERNLEKVGIWGLSDDGRKPKKRSRTAERLRVKRKKQKTKTKSHQKRDDDYDGDVGFDAPPVDGDEFDLQDLVGSVKKDRSIDEERRHSKSVIVPPVLVVGATTKKNKTDDDKEKDTKDSSLKPFAEKEDHDGDDSDNGGSSSDDSGDDRKIAPFAAAAESVEEERRAARMFKLDEQVDSGHWRQQQQRRQLERMEGESKNAYRKRVATETRLIIKRERQESHNPERRRRKLEFLNNRRNKKRKGKSNATQDHQPHGVERFSMSDGNGAFDDDDDLVTAERVLATRERETQVVFGEQAERPPTFRQIPRGAKPSARRHDEQDSAKNANMKKKQKKKNGKDASTTMSDAQVRAEQAAMEAIRQRALDQYALIKARRRKDGQGFHL